MRGTDDRHDGLFSYVRPDSRTTKGHPLRVIRRITDAALASLSARFDALYANEGRPSIPPEQLLRALLLQAFHAIRSERQRKGRTFHTEGEQQKKFAVCHFVCISRISKDKFRLSS